MTVLSCGHSKGWDGEGIRQVFQQNATKHFGGAGYSGKNPLATRRKHPFLPARPAHPATKSEAAGLVCDACSAPGRLPLTAPAQASYELNSKEMGLRRTKKRNDPEASKPWLGSQLEMAGQSLSPVLRKYVFSLSPSGLGFVKSPLGLMRPPDSPPRPDARRGRGGQDPRAKRGGAAALTSQQGHGSAGILLRRRRGRPPLRPGL